MPTQPELFVVVEGKADAILVRRLLSRVLSLKGDFYAGQRQIALASLARNILVDQGGPLLLVKDAQSTDPDTIAESCDLTRAVIHQVAPDDSFEVFAFAPQIEVVFFEAPAVPRRRFGAGLDGTPVEVGRLDPRRTLDALLARRQTSRDDFYRALDDDDLDALLEGPQARRLIEATESLIDKASAVSAAAAHR